MKIIKFDDHHLIVTDDNISNTLDYITEHYYLKGIATSDQIKVMSTKESKQLLVEASDLVFLSDVNPLVLNIRNGLKNYGIEFTDVKFTDVKFTDVNKLHYELYSTIKNAFEENTLLTFTFTYRGLSISTSSVLTKANINQVNISGKYLKVEIDLLMIEAENIIEILASCLIKHKNNIKSDTYLSVLYCSTKQFTDSVFKFCS